MKLSLPAQKAVCGQRYIDPDWVQHAAAQRWARHAIHQQSPRAKESPSPRVPLR
jgi:hypothetical protein